MTSTASLSCVGLGMTLGAHLTPICQSHIDSADLCFVLASDALVELWVSGMHPDVRSLQDFYQSGKNRKTTYREMVEAVLSQVRLGKKVCAIFYGHPGVFAYVPHRLIQQARAEGYPALMEPGISAEDCLIADLGIDPGKYGCAQFEASQFIFYQRIIDPSAYLILWQIGLVGDLNYGIEVTGTGQRQVLLQRLYQDYPQDHAVILYEAATSPLKSVRRESIPLKALAQAELKDYTTLIIPPSRKMEENPEIMAKFRALQLEDPVIVS